MTEEVKAKSRLSNNVLWGILAALVLLIVVLIIGIIIPKNTGKNSSGNTDDNTPKGNYEIAQAACEIIEQGEVNSTEEEYVDAIDRFESVSSDPSVDMQEEFEACYISLANYYTQQDNTEKAAYYNDIVDVYLPPVDEAFLEESRQRLSEEEGVELEHIDVEANNE